VKQEYKEFHFVLFIFRLMVKKSVLRDDIVNWTFFFWTGGRNEQVLSPLHHSRFRRSLHYFRRFCPHTYRAPLCVNIL